MIWALTAFDFGDGSRDVPAATRRPIGSTENGLKLRELKTMSTDVGHDTTLKHEAQGRVDTIETAPVDTTADVGKDETVPDRRAEKVTKPLQMPTVTLFNGCGVKGIGARAKAALERMGFEVVEVRNARNYEYKVSEVLDKNENLEFGRLLADSLGIPRKLAAWDTTRSDPGADVSLIVGSDYRKLRWKLQ